MDTPTRDQEDRLQEHRRQEYRWRTYIGARIVYDGRRRSLRCLVRNRTGGGAKLQVPAGVLLPHKFELVMADKDRAIEACVIWGREAEIGVSFDKPAANVIAFPSARRTSWLDETRDQLQRLSRHSSDEPGD